jgi:hypothetical protein
MGKGSTPRPFTDREIFESNFDAIFGKNKKGSRKNIKPEIFTIPKEKHIHTMLAEYHLHPSTGEVEKRFTDGSSKPNGEQFGQDDTNSTES